MKLELKHLSPYLPYELPIRYIERNETHKLDNNNIMAICQEQKHLKPILRPLSDLTNENTIEFYNFLSLDLELINIEEWTEELINMIKGNDKFQLSQFEYLFKNHFDVFGLIKKGLAIDINTLKK